MELCQVRCVGCRFGLTLDRNGRIWRPKKSLESNGRSSGFPSFKTLAVLSPRKRGRHRQAATWSRATSTQTTLRVDIIWGTASDAFFNPLPSTPATRQQTCGRIINYSNRQPWVRVVRGPVGILVLTYSSTLSDGYNNNYSTSYGANGAADGGGFMPGEPQSSPAQGKVRYGLTCLLDSC